MRTTDIIRLTAWRLAQHATELQLAQTCHGVAAGTVDDLASPDHEHVVTAIYEMTLSSEYRSELGSAYGAVAALMERHANETSGCFPDEWARVQRHLTAAADRLEPRWRSSDHPEHADSSPASRPLPAVLRVDLLAALVTPTAISTLADDARTVVAITSQTASNTH